MPLTNNDLKSAPFHKICQVAVSPGNRIFILICADVSAWEFQEVIHIQDNVSKNLKNQPNFSRDAFNIATF